MKFFQKKKKQKNSIIPKNIDLDHAAVIFNRKKSLGSSLVFEKNKTEEDSRFCQPKKYGSSFQNPFTNDENYTLAEEDGPGGVNKVEDSKDFIKNFLKKKEKKDQMSKLSDYVTQVSTGKG